jgi:uncharacterized protein (DUF2384 family)
MEKHRSSGPRGRSRKLPARVGKKATRWLAKRTGIVKLTQVERALFVRCLSDDGRVVVDRTAEAFGMSKGQLAETVGVAPETLQRTSRADAPKTQTRLREMIEIINRVSDWAGGDVQAMAWYRAQPIPAFGGRTAESLVKDGKAGAVREYLDSVALGGFA